MFLHTSTNNDVSKDNRRVMVIVVGDGQIEPSSNRGRDYCISHSANIVGKDMNPTIFLPA